MPPFRASADGIDLFVRLTPRSSRDEVGGLSEAAGGGVHLIVRVRAVPEKGAANRALERLLAERLGVPMGSVAVIAGGASRLKTVRIAGDASLLAGRLDAVARLGGSAKRG